MLEVYHHSICPFSRQLRIVLNEKQIPFELISEKFWERRVELLKLNPTGELPIIIKNDGVVISSNRAIFEYLEEVMPQKPLLPDSPIERAQVRRISDWFENKCYTEVTRYLITEKFVKVVTKSGEPNSTAIRAANKNILYHIDYAAFLLSQNDYLCGEKISLADFAAAAQFSVLDFFGDMPWERHKKVKHWYSLIKSRPSFRSILIDKIPGCLPPAHYSNPDF